MMNLSINTTPQMMQDGVTVAMCEQAGLAAKVNLWIIPIAVIIWILLTLALKRIRHTSEVYPRYKHYLMGAYWMVVVSILLIALMIIVVRMV